ncbi:MAG: AmmeMemoRadiSam system radical SAM enzyme [bacterium]
MKEAFLYEKKDDFVECHLCSHRCRIKQGKRGICGVRENRDGILYSLVHNLACSCNIDPIEKKPFFHFLPGSYSLSVATVGCNLACKFCQNWTISQAPKDEDGIFGEELPPSRIVKTAKVKGCKSISYTYTEPTIFFEYAFETANIAKKEGLYNNFVTNGYMSPEALKMIAPYLDAANVDLKGDDNFYKTLCNARQEPVLSSIRLMKELGIWVEITTLLIPEKNTSSGILSDIAKFIKEVGEETPWHISRFHPNYKMLDIPPTPISFIERAREIGKNAGLRYVYSGNIPGDPGENTYCYQCKEPIINRIGFSVLSNSLKDGVCPNCKAKIDGIFE